jgi:FeS assembly SUF system regulator
MLRISKMADYGTIVLTMMAKDPGRTQSVAEIGAVTGLPVPSVSKILKIFVSEGLVLSLRGSKGGYKLSRPPEEISTAQILKAIDGPIGMTECSTHPGLCSHESGCQVRANWQMVSRAMLDTLEQITLNQMIHPVIETANFTALRQKRLASGPAKQAVIGEQL